MGALPLRKSKNITAILLEAGVVTPEEVEEGLLRQRETGLRIGEMLVEMEVVSEEDIGWALSRQLQLPFVDLHMDALDPSLVRELPAGVLRRVQAVPLLRSGDELSVAMADPTDGDAIAELERESGATLVVSVATPSKIRSVLDAILGAEPEPPMRDRRDPPAGKYDVLWERSGTTFLLFHLANASKLGATEIHFDPADGRLTVSYRVGGANRSIACERHEVLGYLLARLEALGGPKLEPDRVLARGQVESTFGPEDEVIEVSLARTDEGTAVSLYPRPFESRPPQLAEVGFEPEAISRLQSALGTGAGLLIVGGPPMCGGSRALTALGAFAAAEERRTVILSPRAEIRFPGALSFTLSAAEARTRWASLAVAQSADVVLLDGVLEGQAIRELLGPAGAGRLVLARTDGCDSLRILETLLEEPGATGLLSRRLVALIQCRWAREGEPAAGTTGRNRGHGIYEVLTIDDEMRRQIAGGAGAGRIAELAEQQGLRTLERQVSERVEAGVIPAAEAARILS